MNEKYITFSYQFSQIYIECLQEEELLKSQRWYFVELEDEIYCLRLAKKP